MSVAAPVSLRAQPRPHRQIWWLILACAACVAAYAPGLGGSFLFDDFPNVVDNTAVHVGTADWSDWRRAALSSPSAELRRPLAMLSFAANYYFTGLDPLPMKLTNLLIHLLNGLLVYAVLLKLLELVQRAPQRIAATAEPRTAALILAALWLLCPINLSAVLYVVQRMESLAQLFVLCGLWLYLHGRQSMLASAKGLWTAAAGLVLGTGLGAMCKESAVLLPLYAFLVEWAVLRFAAATPSGRRALWTLFAVSLLLPAIAGLLWLLPRSISPDAYAGRPFTLDQRLLTESRILVRYIVWTLFPRPDELGFYHDDIALSQGWLVPPTTAASAALIAALLAAAAVLRRRIPLFSLGVLWYFAAHLMTATIIPLELVFEHRNYFASIGALLAAGALALRLPPPRNLLRTALPVLAIGAFAAVLALRAREWSDPIRFAYAEAGEHPQSPRANYELGRTLTIASGYRADSKLIDPALRAFEHATGLPNSGASPYAALIVVASHTHRPVDPRWWSGLIEKLTVNPASVEDVKALRSLADCQHQAICAKQTQELLSAFLATLSHPSPGDRLLADYGAFVANQLGDYSLAVRAFREAIAQSPGNADYRIELAEVLILDGKNQEALQTVDSLRLNELEPSQAESLRHLRKVLSPNPDQGGSP